MLITRIWSQQPGKYFCISTKTVTGKWVDHFFSRKEFKDAERFIRDNGDKNLYFCPHGFSTDRRKGAGVLPKLMWADLDEADPKEIEIKPTIAIESSPGRFVGIWMLEDTLDTVKTNQALTYHIEADHSGWDLGQVLRIPGTRNYKYQSMPKVRTLWIDGPTYRLKDIKRKIPEDSVDESDDEALDVYKQYEKELPKWVRRELLNGKPTQGKRSEMMWKLVLSLLEAGVARDDCFTLLKASPWNKFGDDQLKREIEKANGKKLVRKNSKSTTEKTTYRFLAHSLDEVEEEEIDWIWYPYIARGELSILEGDPGVGKSYLAQMVCASIADGRRLPSPKRMPVVQGKIAYFDMENSAGSVTKKRLSTNGLKNFDYFYQEEEPFSIDDEDTVEEVENAIERFKPTVVVFDTLNTYIGKANTHNSAESQQAFSWFRSIAKRYNCSVIVLRHLTKGTRDGKALYRGQGSIAFAGLARVVMSVGLMPDDPDTRVMAVTKINVTRPPKALTYTITELPDTMKERDRSKFEWGEYVDISADDLIAAPPPVKGPNEREEAKKFLEDILSKGPVELKKIEQTCEARSINIRTVYRAADTLGVKRSSTGFGKEKRSMWSLKK